MNWFRRVPKWLLAVMLGAVSISFVFWGIGNVFSFTSVAPIVRVGDTKIFTQEFQTEFTRFLKEQSYQARRPISTEEGRAMGLDLVARDRLVTRLLMEHKAAELGFAYSRSQVIDELKKLLGDGRGNIDPNRLAEVLQNNQMSEQALIAQLQGDRVQRQLYGTILSNVALPPGMVSILQHYRLERRVAEYVLIDPPRAGEIKDPGDTALKAYYTEHLTEFGSPEYRSFVVASVSAKDLAAAVQVKDEDIQKLYDQRKKKYVTPEKRTLEQIQFRDEGKARAAQAALAAGKSFEDVAKEAGFKPDDIKLGEVSADDTSVPPVAFTLALNKPSEPVKNAFGWVIVRATASTPGTVKKLEEVRTELRDELATEDAKKQVIKLSNDYDTARGGGSSIEDAAKTLNIKVTKVAAIDKSGKNEAGQLVEALPVGGDFLSRVFAADAGADTQLQESTDGVYFEFRVDKVTPAAQKKFEAVRNEVFTMWRTEQEHQRLQTIADDLVKRGNGGQSMAALASPLGVAPLKSEPLSRKPPTAGTVAAPTVFSEAGLQALFATKIGGFFSAPVADGKSIIVARVDATQQQVEPADSPLPAMFVQRFNQAFVADVAAQFTGSLRHDICSQKTIWERLFGTTLHDCVDEAQFARTRATE